MHKRQPIVLLLCAVAWGLSARAGQAPVYRLIYSPTSGSPIGYLGPILEEHSGLFYVLSLNDSSTSGGTIFSVTSSGTFNSIHTFQPFASMSTMIQAPNGNLYGSGHVTGTGGYYFYYEMSPAGKNYHQYYAPKGWLAGFETIAAPPGILYDLSSTPSTNIMYGFGGITEGGKVTILHPFSSGDGVPLGNIVYAADGNVYGVGNAYFYATSFLDCS